MTIRRIAARTVAFVLVALTFCSLGFAQAQGRVFPDGVVELARQYSEIYGLPFGIVMRTLEREYGVGEGARNGRYWGLMQIRYDTARGVGYQGPPSGLLDPNINLAYGCAYLANAYRIAGGNEEMTHRLYRGGYYYQAKRKGMLDKLVTGRPIAEPEVMMASLVPQPMMSYAPEPPAVASPMPIAMPMAAQIPLPLPRPALPVVFALGAAPPSPTLQQPAFAHAAGTPPAMTMPKLTVAAALSSAPVDGPVLGMPTPRERPRAIRVITVASVAIPLPRAKPLE